MTERPPMLTWDEFEWGVPCRACGRRWDALSDDLSGDRATFDAEHAGGGRQLLSGYDVVHCLTCCPPPPMSPETIDRVVELLLQMGDKG